MAEDNGRDRSALTLAVAAQIRAERAASGMTQRQVMQASGIPKSTYLRLESGERVADVSQLAKFCAAVGISMSELMHRAEERLPGVARTPEAIAADALSQLSPETQESIRRAGEGLRPKRHNPPTEIEQEA